MYQYVQENQQQEHIFVLDQHAQNTDITLQFNLEAYATLTVYMVIIDVSARVKIECNMRGEGAHARIYGAYSACGDNNVSITTVLHHHAAYTNSSLIMKGIVRDTAQAQYHGTIRIEKEAHETHASQENKNILLSNAARAISVPNLEVLTNDVKCFHGSAVGRFDQDQVFYAACRGIDENVAEKLLLHAFFADVVIDESMAGMLLSKMPY